jgi:putative peptidoglycan lipid II flippase
MLPSLLFICLFGLNASLLQCEKSYFVPSVAPVAFNGIWIAAVFYLKDMPAQQAMPWLSLGVVIACLSQWLMTVPQTWKSLKNFLPSSSFWISMRESLSDLRRLSKPLFLGILGVAASQINNAVDSLFARFADPEGPALLWYAIRIQQLPLALFGIAIAGAILPPLSRALKGGRTEEYDHFLQDALSRTWMFMLPLTAALFVMGDTSVQFLYGRGDFGTESVIQTTYCLWAYGIGLLPSALVLILAPASYAQSNYKLLAIASFATMLLNLVLNSLFIMSFGWGAVSVAIATSISAWVNFIVLGWSLSKTGPSVFSPETYKHSITITLATLAAVSGTYQLRIAFQKIPLFADALFSSTFIEQFITLSSQGLAFGFFLLFSFYLLKQAPFLRIKQILNEPL